ncbi:uncharacterized protein LOC121991238 [Zingiber officinale]|uniref:uncharacterized protein LOC121991238 n=1 Tax=Zingiber officinale TaxID=94328 RepID=UPI001C4C3D79|nr:uncharacterized protein LOC121991238 [Zingiber officinale]
MAYRRRHSTARSATFEDYRSFSCVDDEGDSSHSLATKAIRASAAHRDSSLSSAYDGADVPSAPADRRSFHKQGSNVYEYSTTTRKNITGRQRFWEVLAKKAKAILEDEEQPEDHSQKLNSKDEQVRTKCSNEKNQKTDQSPAIQKDAIVSSLTKESSGTLKHASKEGIPAIEATKKLQIKNPESSDSATEAVDDFTQFQIEYENKLKASQKVANAIAAKAKLLLRELKTVKADFAFAKERCAQLEEENKALRENRQKGENPADDDELIRHQLETLLEEKARLARENSVYASENRFLHEIIEYHQLTMQDVVYLDEGIEEMTEVYPISQMSSVLPRSSSVSMDKEALSPSSSPKI